MDLCSNALLIDLELDLEEWNQSMLAKRQKRLLNGQWNQVDEFSWQEAAAALLRKSFFKKFEDRSSQQADKAALDQFVASNIRCGEWKIRDDRSLEDDLLLGLFKAEVYKFFNKVSYGHILTDTLSLFHNGDVGPGSSYLSNGTDFYTKLCAGPLVGTRESMFSLYEHAIQNIPLWKFAEKRRSEEYGEFTGVRGNRLSFVPKNADISRCICVEPVLNMFFQQGIRRKLERRLVEYFGIDLSTQPDCNKILAQMGSKDQSYCTIDLKAASDSMSLRMIRSTLPADVVRWLEWSRSPSVQLPDGDWMELKMLSTMGNAFTFPLQTILFSCVVSSVFQAQEIGMLKGYTDDYQLSGKTGVANTRRLPNFGVFGDDIIVPPQAYRQTVRLLNILGFTVNDEKSFSTGPFRESCGGDYYLGHLVRGVYIKSLKTQASRYVAINRLNQWSAMTGISLSRTVGRLQKTVRFLPVPLAENDDAGIKVPSCMVQNLKRCRDTQSVKYRKWVSKPNQITVLDDVLVLPSGFRGSRRRFFNEDGLYLASLRGDIRNGKLGSRLGPTRYRTKEAVTPFWDYLPPAAALASGFSQSRLIDAILINLIS
jgi:hypothetical protein